MTAPITNHSGFGWHLLTTFGLGYRRPASGTWGSLPPILVAAILLSLGLGPGEAPWVFYPVLVAIVIVFSVVCVVRGDEAQARWGHDPSEVVADETAGQAIALLAFPAAGAADPRVAIFLLAVAFFAFRFFDITKLEPANALQKLPSGWGVLLDDWAAGIYAGVAVLLAGMLVT